MKKRLWPNLGAVFPHAARANGKDAISVKMGGFPVKI